MIISHTELSVRLDNVGKKYPFNKSCLPKDGDFWALKAVSLDICRGGVFGIIGRNGAGKTTLLNIIAGTLSHNEGSLSINGRVVGLFNLGVGFTAEPTWAMTTTEKCGHIG